MKNNSEFNNNSELKIRPTLNSIWRNKLFVLLVTSISILVSIIYALSLKKVWKGEFGIVVSSNNKSSSILGGIGNKAGINAILPDLFMSGGIKKNLKTEVEILKSPSTLMPIFNYVKEIKKLEGANVDKWNFDYWYKKNIEIKLVGGTSVLKIFYKDKDKNLILKVLNDISNTYQNYSNKNKSSTVNRQIEYLDNQILKYRDISSKSQELVQKFAYENYIFAKFDPKSGQIITDIERERIEAIKTINRINKTVELIENNDMDMEIYFYFAKTVMPDFKSNNAIILDKINKDLAILRSSFLESDPEIRKLLVQRKSILQALKKDIKGFLNMEKIKNLSIQISSEREDGLIYELKELITKANRDSLTLLELENSKRALSLEKFRNAEPWELITQPTILPNAVKPNRKKIAFVGMSLGLFFSVILSKFLDNKKGLIFEDDDYSSLFKLNILKKLSFKNRNKWNEDLKLLYYGSISKINNSEIAIFPIGEIENNYCEGIVAEFVKINSNKEVKFIFYKEIIKLISIDYVIFICKDNITTKKMIENLLLKLDNLSIKPMGVILLKND